MARFTTLFVALALASCQLGVHAAPLSGRAGVGSFIQCNLARLKTVGGLAGTTSAVQKLAGAAGADAATSSAVTAAQAGLKDAQTGIQTIAQALISGQAPPADARDQVGKGLNAAQTALAGITSTDPTVAAQVQTAQDKLKQTISAGQQVVDTCGGGGAAGTSLSSMATASMTATQITTSGVATVTDAATTSAVSSLTWSYELKSADPVILSRCNQASDCAASVVTQTVTVTAQPTDGAASAAAPTETAAPTPAAATTTTKGRGGQGKNGGLLGLGVLRKRQIGNLRCNIARLQTVGALSASTKAVGKVATAAGSDAASATAAQDAQTGLKSAQDGIATIAKALLTGQSAPAAARTQVEDGLNAAKTSLASITSFVSMSIIASTVAQQGQVKF
ncbi:hypothetical protein LshimejAT787_1402300 [Lyophyllum shimeji]|uniref:Uncharacterized protein n=1 Tax=Lyophyllum shimeji TaxID=47721 RepID=A0A9P3USK9_LYOSH|nr:hypothetical protein LshimejAT787_1402300 [Lyophyllum shimeji]